MPQDNRLIIAIGAGAAVIAAVILALIFGGNRERPDTPPPAAQGGLVVDVSDAPAVSETRQLRCYVEGQMVGMATLADCARRNGLATDALEVGVDQSGAQVAFTPPPGPPPLTEKVQPTSTPAVQPNSNPNPNPAPAPTMRPTEPTQASGSACLRHTSNGWRQVSAGTSLNECVQSLYAGFCVRPGDAQYGRWGDTTLRLVPGRVEQSADNQTFRTLTRQNRSCQFPELG